MFYSILAVLILIKLFRKSIYHAPNFYMRFCNGVDENFQDHFVLYISDCITEACITNSILRYKSLHNNHGIFYDEMVLIDSLTPLQSLM